jgi:hypothetical protein
MKTLGILERSKKFWVIFASTILFFFLRLPSLFEPYWYGDEGVYQVLGTAINKGRLLYQGIFDNKPPLLYVFYSLFNGDQFYVKLFSLFFGILAIVVFFYLAGKLFKNNLSVYVSTFLFTILFGLPIIEGNIANAENFMLFFILAGFYLAIDHFGTKWENKMFFWSGIVLGLAFLFKIVAVFDFAALLVFLIIIKTPLGFTGKLYKKLLNEIKNLYSLIVGFLIPIATCAIFFLTQGAFSDFITATLFSNVGYVGYGNRLIIPQGFLILKLIPLSFYIGLIFIKRRRLNMTNILILVWIGFSVFNALFSQRPYTHYLLTLLPSFALLVGLIFEKNEFRKTNIALILAVIILATQSFWIYTKNFTYYQNFLSFVLSNKSVVDYQRFFDKKTPIDYQVAQYIRQNSTSSDSIFVWGNNPQLYKLSEKLPPGKYTVAYHIRNYKDGIVNTENALKKKSPKLVIIMPGVGNYPFSLVNYKLVIVIDKVYIYEKIF